MNIHTGLYIHWPFCTKICPYCDFTVTRSRGENANEWTEKYIEDLIAFWEMTGPRELATIYFGGGTPSLMPPECIEKLVNAAADIFSLSEGAEITLEANPTDAEVSAFTDLQAAGINRLSLGVQSYDDRQLAFLGRNHSGGEARTAVEVACSTFESVSLDFIYGLPDENLQMWRKRLSEILQTTADHLSFYQLTIEKKTAFDRAVERREWTPLADDIAADLYELTQDMTAAAGWPGYEVSNHAVPGREAVHNRLYWSGQDWIGVGPGAHGRLTFGGGRHAISSEVSIRNWLHTDDRYCSERLDDTAIATELLAGALRTKWGLSVADLPSSTAVELTAQLEKQRLLGNIEGADVIRIPQEKRLVTDYIIGQIMEAL